MAKKAKVQPEQHELPEEDSVVQSMAQEGECTPTPKKRKAVTPARTPKKSRYVTADELRETLSEFLAQVSTRQGEEPCRPPTGGATGSNPTAEDTPATTETPVRGNEQAPLEHTQECTRPEAHPLVFRQGAGTRGGGGTVLRGLASLDPAAWANHDAPTRAFVLGQMEAHYRYLIPGPDQRVKAYHHESRVHMEVLSRILGGVGTFETPERLRIYHMLTGRPPMLL
eukprot:TRINITY_DN3673_c1_g1_i4.p1 TRINITY_DN3673_c1_g1~~TRINITY_DN3673_c1_g1_i4.p1  ORF type:complete len:226 (+),score=11.65 TRINITY_DN3673_c1_g1_i4:190-867(+)